MAAVELEPEAASGSELASAVALAQGPVQAPERGLARATVELEWEPRVGQAPMAAAEPHPGLLCKSVRKRPLHRHADRRYWRRSTKQPFRLHFPTGRTSPQSMEPGSSPSSCNPSMC
jgi:hypothetical protein